MKLLILHLSVLVVCALGDLKVKTKARSADLYGLDGLDSSFGLSGGLSDVSVGKDSAGLGYGLGGDSEISALDLGEGYGIGEKSSGLGYGHGGGGGGGGGGHVHHY
ncbi:hypothetical protein JTE90_020429 [Oedothorax gibbosus]|uniref:Glycine-rich protein n=1 Tax=Oedothorax gibbosus TaxID=931172 RepID=A0AAV6UFI8_9ARAC|nr:hypothetical protein JTE90_020429 [Oedothorax gibbosus]